MTIQINDNKILISSDNKIAAHDDCCCEDEGCPNDCGDCGSTYSITISGFTTGLCASCNGTFGGNWESDCAIRYDVTGSIYLNLFCTGGLWYINLYYWPGAIYFATFSKSLTPCPGGIYTFLPGMSLCPDDTPTAVVTIT